MNWIVQKIVYWGNKKIIVCNFCTQIPHISQGYTSKARLKKSRRRIIDIWTIIFILLVHALEAKTDNSRNKGKNKDRNKFGNVKVKRDGLRTRIKNNNTMKNLNVKEFKISGV